MRNAHLDASQLARLHELFGESAELPAAERVDFVDSRCGDDPALRAELIAMLDALPPEDDEFLIEPLLSSAVSNDLAAAMEPASAESELPDPETVGPYRIDERIGKGGMGVVYRATQAEPVRREVALKVIQPGMDTERVIARFEAERHALARMNHPGVARIYDSGATEAGRPWFAMELVRGEPLVDYCTRHRVSTRARLELFATICDAVQHAHQKGIVHRDLKPSNVLVGDLNGRPHAIIIDFGIARAVSEPLVDCAPLTREHETLGTVDYMAPEQAVNDGDVDSRADIYSLGVMLFELLSGELPFDRSTPIEHRTTHPPSQRIGKADATTAVALAQASDVHVLRRTLRGELDWITMKALEFDRERRYPSAAELAAETRRYLHDQPVLAGPPSTWYRWRTFARRYRAQVVAGSVALLALIIGSVAATWGMFEAQRQSLGSDRLANLAMKALAMSRLESEIDEVEAEVDGAFADRPNEEAVMRTLIGRKYIEIDRMGKAVTQLERCVKLHESSPAPNLRDLFEVLSLYGRPLEHWGKIDRAGVSRRRANDVAIASLVPDHPKLASMLLQLSPGLDKESGDRTEALVKSALLYADSHNLQGGHWGALAYLLSRHVNTVRASANYYEQLVPYRRWFSSPGRMLVEGAGLSAGDPRAMWTMWMWLWCWTDSGQGAEALAHLRSSRSQVVELERTYFPDSAATEHVFHNVRRFVEAHALMQLGQYEASLPILADCVEKSRHSFASSGIRSHLLMELTAAAFAAANADLPAQLANGAGQRVVPADQRDFWFQWVDDTLGSTEGDLIVRMRGLWRECREGRRPSDQLRALVSAACKRFDGMDPAVDRAAVFCGGLLRFAAIGGNADWIAAKRELFEYCGGVLRARLVWRLARGAGINSFRWLKVALGHEHRELVDDMRALRQKCRDGARPTAELRQLIADCHIFDASDDRAAVLCWGLVQFSGLVGDSQWRDTVRELLEHCDEVLGDRESPVLPLALWRLADLEFRAGNLERSLEIGREGAALDEVSGVRQLVGTFRGHVGRCLDHLDPDASDNPEAETFLRSGYEFFNDTLRLADPQPQNAFHWRLDYLRRRGRHAECIDLVQQRLNQLRRQSAPPSELRRSVYELTAWPECPQSAMDLALATAREIHALRPDMFQSHLALGCALLRAGHDSNALAILREAERMRRKQLGMSGQTALYAMLATAFARSDQDAEAKEALVHARAMVGEQAWQQQWLEAAEAALR